MDKIIFLIYYIKKELFNKKSLLILLVTTLVIVFFTLMSKSTMTQSVWSDVFYILTHQIGFLFVFLLPFMYIQKNTLSREDEIVISRFNNYQSWCRFQVVSTLVISFFYCLLYFMIVFTVTYFYGKKTLLWGVSGELNSISGFEEFTKIFSPTQGIIIEFIRYYLVLNLICMCVHCLSLIGGKCYKYKYVITIVIYFVLTILKSYSISFLDFDCNAFRLIINVENFFLTVLMGNAHILLYYLLYIFFIKNNLLRRVEVYYEDI